MTRHDLSRVVGAHTVIVWVFSRFIVRGKFLDIPYLSIIHRRSITVIAVHC